jgi:N-acetylglucosamine kinase-like BadF-type ATPase
VKLLATLRLLVSSVAPTGGATQGAVYYDSADNAPRYYDGTQWVDFNQLGFPDPAIAAIVPDGRQVIYFDKFTNDGVLTINGTGTLIGMV